MFRKLREMFTRRQPESFSDAIEKAALEAASQFDWDDPNQRTGVSLYLVLSKQFGLIGKPEGGFPYIAPFATDKARGALLGTAIAIVRQQRGDVDHQAVVDTVVAAFGLTYGEDNGRIYALETMRDSADGNSDVNFASDWAIKDADGAMADDSPASPAAFYLAVSGMI